MVRRLLIANRGEVARRVIRTCRLLGIETVAVYSDADAAAVHVREADRAVHVGPALSSESYLSTARLVDAARQSEADAVHPGYGFLSENAEFAAACRDAGLTFVGPSTDVIAKTGSKPAVRQLAESVGVPVVPGEEPTDQTPDGLRAAVDHVGYPVLLKPAAGGGGKGMRVVHRASDIDAAVASARREAEAAFGDGTLYVERHLVDPRHVEVQVAGDSHGRVVHFFERDCSIQRRYQKIIEESPSPHLDPTLRDQMTVAAVAVARAAEYDNLGTVEFLVEGEGATASFHFLEVNTRLQVEHPVTELCTGVDLVRAQIEIADGDPVPWTQADVAPRGHAIECRIYAEDPAADFLPQAGPLLLYREPTGPGIRVDAGVAEGDTVTVHYDPLLAKLAAWGETREWARRRAIDALTRYVVLGLRTNLSFLRRVLEDPRFRDGHTHTGFLAAQNDEGRAALTADPPPSLDQPALVAALAATGAARHAAASTDHPSPRHLRDPWSTLRSWR